MTEENKKEHKYIPYAKTWEEIKYIVSLLPDDLLLCECIKRGYFDSKKADSILRELGQEP